MSAPTIEEKPVAIPAEVRQSALIAGLHCPYCGSRLERELTIPATQAGSTLPDGTYGILRCACHTYPILEGIPVLQHLDGLPEVVRRLRGGDARGALLHAMNVFRITWAQKTRWHQARYHVNCRRLASDATLTFEDALELVRKPKGFADYLLHRFGNPSFFAAMSLLPLFGRLDSAGRRIRVLDLGCGAGHSTSLITRWFPQASVVACDQDFISLYLARRFMAPDVDYVCSDAEVPSPFADREFDGIHCLDAFHYFKSKQAIVSELSRVAKDRALWLFPHLHNALAENITAGIPLAPEGYRRLFAGQSPVLIDEDELIGNRCREDRFAGLAATSDALSTAQSLALVAGGPTSVLEGQESVPSWMLRAAADLRINPLYAGSWNGSTLRLELRWPNEVFHRECRKAEAILPATVDMTAGELQDVLAGRAAERLHDLLCSFVLVPLPPRYSRTDLLAALPGKSR